MSFHAQAQFSSVLTLDPITLSASTGEKPQSKVWEYDGSWWCVLPTNLRGTPSGTWIWKLVGTTWVGHLQLSTELGTVADVKVAGSIVHILLYDDDPELVSVEYVGGSYQLWSTRPAPSPVLLPGSETATIDIDSTGRMWLSTEAGNDVVVYYSDAPYSSWTGPVTLATGINSDDITAVTALPDNTIGVLWSNQVAQRFGFRIHADSDDPNNWSTDEVPASQSASNAGSGMADDHVNLATASDGTLYAAVKTSYDTDDYPKVALLVRRPSGSWDALYEVDTSGTRPIVVLNEREGIVTVIYTSAEGNHDIVYKQSSTSDISFGPRSTLIIGSYSNATSCKDTVTDNVVVLASNGGAVISALATFSNAGLVACYMMEENGGTVLVDSSAYGNDGALNGEPGWTTGIDGLAIDLDGADDYGLTPDDASLDITNAITLAAWVKPEKSGTQYIIKKGLQSDTDGYELSFSSSGTAFTRFNQTSNGNAYRINSARSYPTDGVTWAHLAATYDGSTIRLYFDGEEDSTSAPLAFTIASNELPLGIGAESDGGRPFQGLMDEARVYNRALDAGEIAKMATVAEPVLTADLTITKDDGLKSANPGDSITYIIVVENTGPEDVNGSAVMDNFPAELTDISWSTEVSNGASSTQGGGISDINDLVYLPSGSSITYIVEATIDVAAFGVLSNTATVAAPEGITDLVLQNNSATDTTLLLTDVGDPDLVACYMMEENGGSVLVDSSLYGNDGALNGDPGWTTGIDGLAIVLDGIDDYALAPHNASLDITDVITLAAWIRPEKAGTQYIVKKALQHGTDGYELSLSASGTAFTRFNQLSNANTYRIDTALPYPTDGLTWVHLAATYDGSIIRLYFNGVEDSLSAPLAFTIASNELPLGIGAESDGGRSFQGLMDEARVYNRVLDASEIAELANVAETDPNLIAHYMMEQDGGTTLVDSSPYGNDGTLYGDPEWIEGIDGLAIDLDGADDYALTPHTASLDITNTITLAAWVKPEKAGTQYIAKKALQSNTDGYELSFSSSGKVFTRFNQTSSGNAYRINTVSSYPTDGTTWIHLAATYDGSIIRLYFNGQEESASEPLAFAIATNSLPVGIGAESDGGRPFQGLMDEVRVYNRALDAGEIAELANVADSDLLMILR